MKISISKTYLILLFYIAPFIDALSGYLVLSKIIMEGGAGSPSQLFRLLIMLIALILLLEDKKKFLTIVLFVGYVITIEFSFFMIHQNLYGYIIGLVYGNKLVYLLLIFMSLHIMLKSKFLSYLDLIKHIRNYITITAIILSLSFLFGVGFNTYGEGTFGFKGFFAAGNGLGVFQGIGLLISIYYWKVTQERYSLVFALIILFSTVIIGSKTALILSLLGFLSIIIFTKSIWLKSLVILLISLTIGIYINDILDIFYTVFDVILFRFGNSDSIFSWIFSNRDNYFIDAINSVSFDGLLILRLFIGFGAFISFREPLGNYPSIDILESDFADVLFMYGILFIVIYVLFILFNLYKGLNSKKFFLTFIFLLIISHSLIAGHVLFNGMSGVLVPLLSLLILNQQQGIK